jgi:hypothetical protein
LASLHHSVEENLVEDKHVSILGSDLLDPLDLDLVGGSRSPIELNIDLRDVWQINHGVEAISVDHKDLQLLSELILGSSHKLPHNHTVIGHFRLNLEHILVYSIISRGCVELEAEIVG